MVYGILGGFVFVELIFKPLHRQLDVGDARNTLGGGLTLGLLTLPESRRREALKAAFAQILEKSIESRVAAFDKDAGFHAARLIAARKTSGQPGDLRDTMIAGIVISTSAILATRNTSHFDDLPLSVVNPWRQ